MAYAVAMIAEHVELPMFTVVIGAGLFLLAVLTLVVQMIKLRDHRRANGPNSSYSSMRVAIAEEKKDRLREYDRLSTSLDGLARTVGKLSIVVGDNGKQLAVILALEQHRGTGADERTDLLKTIKKLSTAILNKSPGGHTGVSV